MNEFSFFNTLLNDRNLAFPVIKTTSGNVPKVDARETKSSYIIDMDLPGFSENEVEISIKDNVLAIFSKEEEIEENKENKEACEEENDFQWLIHERCNSAFERRFSLPRDIDAEGISAAFKNGVLTVTIPRKAAPGARKINISVA